jgi:hypothetical protein
MEEAKHIVQYTKQQLDDMIAHGEDRTDWARVDAMTEEELEASIDWDEEGETDWSTVMTVIPGRKQ